MFEELSENINNNNLFSKTCLPLRHRDITVLGLAHIVSLFLITYRTVIL